MKAIQMSFLQMLSSIKRDMILLVACLAPLLVGFLFKIGVPIIENAITGWLSLSSVLTPYYGLFDMFFAILTPVMFCFVAAMIVLEETDDRITTYLFTTPLGRKGYLAARFGIPALIAFIVTIILLPLFKLTALSTITILMLTTGGTLQGLILALLIVTFSSNKLEGMAVTKLSTLTIMGVIVPYFVHHQIGYVLSPLPSFWLGRAMYENSSIDMLVSIIISIVWIVLLLKRFMAKTT